MKTFIQDIDDYDIIEQERYTEIQRQDFLRKIDDIYDNIIEKMRMGNFIVYNDGLFCHMTKEKFTKWVIENNLHISQ